MKEASSLYRLCWDLALGLRPLKSFLKSYGLGFFMVHFSKLAFNHNQEEGSNPLVLCTTGGCNRAISGETVLYFTSRCIFYCLVWFNSKTLPCCRCHSTFLEMHSNNNRRPDAEWSGLSEMSQE